MSLLSEYLPDWNYKEQHQALVAAPARRVYQSALELDLAKSPLTSFLFKLRELPMRLTSKDWQSPGMGSGFDDLLELGFLRLAASPPHEFVLGLVGNFWTLSPEIKKLTSQGFKDFAESGYAKVAFNFAVDELKPGLSRLSTETRIQCLGPSAQKAFRAYWLLIRPFSGLTRREMLRLVRKQAEAS